MFLENFPIYKCTRNWNHFWSLFNAHGSIIAFQKPESWLFRLAIWNFTFSSIRQNHAVQYLTIIQLVNYISIRHWAGTFLTRIVHLVFAFDEDDGWFKFMSQSFWHDRSQASLPGFQVLPLLQFGSWGPEITSKFDPMKDTYVMVSIFSSVPKIQPFFFSLHLAKKNEWHLIINCEPICLAEKNLYHYILNLLFSCF